MIRAIEVECRCGLRLFRYHKYGRGRLIKCYISRITRNYAGIDLAGTSRPHCPTCGRSLGYITMAYGKPALKLNQGTIRPLRS